MSNEALKPCPGCGDENPRLIGRDAGFIYCTNDDCGWEVRSPEPYSDAEAARIWNTRSLDTPVCVSREAYERVKRALADQQVRFPDEPVHVRPDDLRSVLAASQAPETTSLHQEIQRLRALISEQSIERLATDIACAFVDSWRQDIVAMRHSAMVRLGERLRNPLPRDTQAALSSQENKDAR